VNEVGTLYVLSLSEETFREIQNRCVTIDPGRRDLLFCIDVKSIINQPIKFRFTKPQQDIWTKSRKYRHFREAVMTPQVQLSLATITNARSVTMDDYLLHLTSRSQASAIVSEIYSNTMVNNRDTPLLRKLKLSSYIRKQKPDKKLIAELSRAFGEDAVYIIRNRSALDARYHEPIRGIGFRRLFKKHGRQIYLIDEYNTSKICPACDGLTLVTVKDTPNPRPYRRMEYPMVVFHGLLG
jgi:transposase